MIPTKKFSLEFASGAAQFECVEHEGGTWVCFGEIKEVEYEIKFSDAASTLVFQHIENLVKHSI